MIFYGRTPNWSIAVSRKTGWSVVYTHYLHTCTKGIIVSFLPFSKGYSWFKIHDSQDPLIISNKFQHVKVKVTIFRSWHWWSLVPSQASAHQKTQGHYIQRLVRNKTHWQHFYLIYVDRSWSIMLQNSMLGAYIMKGNHFKTISLPSLAIYLWQIPCHWVSTL